MTVIVRFHFGHLDRMPKCRHGRVEGFCLCHAIAGEAQRGETVQQGSTGTASTRAEGIAEPRAA